MNVPGPPFDAVGAPPHLAKVTGRDGQIVFLECASCTWMAIWDGERRTMNRVSDGDPNYAHSGSW